MSRVVVGFDPEQARRLVGALRQAEEALDATSVRVQRLLDEAGISGAVPLVLRGVARTCGAEAADLDRRAGVAGGPGPLGRVWNWSPGPSCGPAPLPSLRTPAGRPVAAPCRSSTLARRSW